MAINRIQRPVTTTDLWRRAKPTVAQLLSPVTGVLHGLTRQFNGEPSVWDGDFHRRVEGNGGPALRSKPFPAAEARSWHPVEIAKPGYAAGGSAVAAVSRASTHMEVWWVHDDGWLHGAWWTEEAGWQRPYRVPDATRASKTAGIAALSRGSDHMELFWINDSDGWVYHAWWTKAAGWQPARRLRDASGASKQGGIAAVSRSSDEMDVFWVGEDGWLHTSAWTDVAGWQAPDRVPAADGASKQAGIAALSLNNDQIDLFWVGDDGSVRNAGWTTVAGWQPPRVLADSRNASQEGGIAALSRDSAHMEAWWVDEEDGSVWGAWWTRATGWKPAYQVPDSIGASRKSGLAAISRTSEHMELWWIGIDGSIYDAWWTSAAGWQSPYVLPAVPTASESAGIAALSRGSLSMEVWWIGASGSVQDAWWQDVAAPPSPPALLESATRQILKATQVPIKPPVAIAADPAWSGGLTKLAAVRQLALNPGDTESVRAHLGATTRTAKDESSPVVSEGTFDLLGAFERPLAPTLAPDLTTVAEAPTKELAAFAAALVELRLEQLQRDASNPTADNANLAMGINTAAVAARTLAAGAVEPIGMLNLERIEMVPAGIERGELVATIPMAPGEETAVTHKEWSFVSKEFTSIVTDELEEVSETGVTDTTDLAQSTSSQTNHSNQFNITGTVQGGIPIISGSSTTSFTAQDSASTSATESVKHSRTLTEKASARSRREHKVTVSTKTETGTSETSTRVLKNTSQHPIRIDYFSLMRRWRVRLYRYGLRLTYDVVVPEPGAALRRTYKDLAHLRAQLGPFHFSEKNDFAYLTEEVVIDGHGNTRPRYRILADEYDVAVGEPPENEPKSPLSFQAEFGTGGSWFFKTLPVEMPDGVEIRKTLLDATIDKFDDDGGNPVLDFFVVGAALGPNWTNQNAPINFANHELKAAVMGNPPFLEGYVGKHTVTFFFNGADKATVNLKVFVRATQAAKDRWRNEVWTALYNGAQAKYLALQQEITARIAALENQIANVDTLTLRREENDEIMRSVLRFVLSSTWFGYLPAEVENEFVAKFPDGLAEVASGTIFDTVNIPDLGDKWAAFLDFQEKVRFINQAIEWENVVTFLYSYFWDFPKSWRFIRNLSHPDKTRQAFLRAGAARVVLTVRKGWEQRWTHFTKTGEIKLTDEGIPSTPYLTVAQEIAAYDDRNYPGIAPANPERTAARLQDAVFTTCSEKVMKSPNAAKTIRVASSGRFVVGLRVLLDKDAEGTKLQEEVLIVAIPNDTEITVDRVSIDHDGSTRPFVVLQPGERGALIAEWSEYTPTSGTDIAVTSNLTSIN